MGAAYKHNHHATNNDNVIVLPWQWHDIVITHERGREAQAVGMMHWDADSGSFQAPVVARAPDLKLVGQCGLGLRLAYPTLT